MKGLMQPLQEFPGSERFFQHADCSSPNDVVDFAIIVSTGNEQDRNCRISRSSASTSRVTLMPRLPTSATMASATSFRVLRNALRLYAPPISPFFQEAWRMAKFWTRADD